MTTKYLFKLVYKGTPPPDLFKIVHSGKWTVGLGLKNLFVLCRFSPTNSHSLKFRHNIMLVLFYVISVVSVLLIQ